METHKLSFIFPDDKYCNWLCSEVEWKVDDKELLKKDPVIEADIVCTPLHSPPSNEYIPVYCAGGYGYRPEGINPTGHVNFSKAQFQVIVSTTIQKVDLWLSLIDPNDETNVEKVQMIQTTVE